MPNWTTNAIACHKDATELFINGNNVDFELMRPMPGRLYITSGGCQDQAVKAALGASEDELNMHYPYKSDPSRGCTIPFDVNNFDDLKRLGEVYLENERRYGFQDWYGWCCHNWGTKWNAFESGGEEYGDLAIITFETAWCPPSSEMFDETLGKAGFSYIAESFDEDFCGVYGWKGGSGGLIYKTVHEVSEWEDEPLEWDTGEYDPDIEELKRMLGI